MYFTKTDGEVVDVNPKDVKIVEQNPNYTVYSAKSNPSGETMMAVKYNDGSGEIIDGAGVGADMNQTVEDMDNEQAIPSPEVLGNPKKGKFANISWQNLRLQSAISGESGVAGSTISAVKRIGKKLTGGAWFGISSSESIRDHPMLFTVTAKDWYAYIKNMNIVDVGAEFSAGVSHANRASVALFAVEWENDPGHTNLIRRLMAHADGADAVAKGQIAYDVLTRGHDVLGQRGFASSTEDKAYRLCYDIIRSLPINQYNFYSLYQLHPDEGDEMYQEFKSRYVPLDTAEVEMVNEMLRALEDEGDGYAFRTTANEQSALLAAKLMKTAVASYEIGDTVTTRTALSSLAAAPYNYQSRGITMAMHGAVSSEDGALPEDKRIHFVKLDTEPGVDWGKTIVKKMGKHYGVYAIGLKDDNFQPNDTTLLKNEFWGKKDNNKDKEWKNKKTLIIVRGPNDPTPTHVATKAAKGGKVVILKYDEQYLRDGSDDRKGKKARSVRQGLNIKSKYKDKKTWKDKKNPRKNPKGKGRGNFLFVELHTKNEFSDLKRREPKAGGQKGETRHGKGKIKLSQTYWTKGLHKFLPDVGQMLQLGILKSTGEEAPFRIKLPITHFKVISHPTAGYRTIMPKKEKSNKEFIKAYQDFLNYYGLPKWSKSKDTYYRFKTPKADKPTTPYYMEVRKKSGMKAK